VQLTADAPGQTGAAWLPAKQQVQDGFTATFAWQINRARAVGGDGFAFVIQNTSAMALGEGGSGMGYSGIANSLAVEFDTTQNTPEEWGGTQGDPNANHLSVQSRGTMPNSADPTYSLGTTSTIPALADGAIHQAQITYTPGTLTIFLDDFTTPVLTIPVDLATTLELSDGQAWVGFTAATGSRSQVHAIRAFSVTD
jgi:peptide-N4-(N-acetyl-beta-glucosaminyl)asparagine amidase